MNNKEIVINFEKYIYYQKNRLFLIVPVLNDMDIISIQDFINDLKQSYLIDGNSSFLWQYECVKKSITIDETIEFVEADIFYQFSKIALWLFSKGYDLQGSFWYRTDRIIEYIACDGDNKSITHYIIDDVIKPDADTEIILDAEEKIREFKRIKFYNSTSNIRNELMYRAPNDLVKINDVQKRLYYVESRLQNIKQEHKSLWNACAYVSLVAIGTIIVFTLFASENPVEFNNPTFNQYNITTSTS